MLRSCSRYTTNDVIRSTPSPNNATREIRKKVARTHESHVRRNVTERNLLVPIGADASGLVVLGAIIVGAIIEGAVPLSHRSASPLVHKVPVEAREGSVLRAFALYEERTLLDAEFFQVSGMRIRGTRHYFGPRSRCLLVAASPPCRRRRSYMYVRTIFADRGTRASRFSRVRCSRLSRSFPSLSRLHSLPLILAFANVLFSLPL